jgi:hypothetical protein
MSNSLIFPSGKADGQPKPIPPEVPRYAYLCLRTPLYDAVPYDKDRDVKWLDGLKLRAFQFDAYCTGCGMVVPFRTVDREVPADGEVASALANSQLTWAKERLKQFALAPGLFAANMTCQRLGHVYSFIFAQTADTVTKIGQTPSMEDIVSVDLLKFKSILGSDYALMAKAGGCISHGLGIAAFAYLRRVFANIIEGHRTEYETTHGPIAGWASMRFAEQVSFLKNTLPDLVVKNVATYGILSAGIHELEEGECRTYYPVLRAAILMMLEEDYETKERRRRADDLTKEINKISDELGQKNG